MSNVKTRPLPSLFYGRIRCKRFADIDLAGPADASTLSLADLSIVGDPAGHTPYGKDHRKHFHRNPNRTHHDAAIEIHVWIKLSFDKIRVMQGCLLQLRSDIKQRVIDLERCKQLVALAFD